ncbi:MAG: hypothetical protein ACKO5J_02520 [Rubrivivax sp.]
MPVDALPPLSRAAPVADRASTLRLAGLTCAGCGAAIEAALAGVPGVAWTRGLLQSAVVVAALCHTPGAGALAMGGFALASAPGLLVTPWVLRWLGRGGPQRAGWGDGLVRVAIRLSGLALAGGALVATNRDAWHRFVAYCTS